MTLSIEVLPAPFGPMMARISPGAISKDTSVNAFTPPNERETFSTERIALPACAGGRSAGGSGPEAGDSASRDEASPPPHLGLPAAVRPSPSRGGWSNAVALSATGEAEEAFAGPLMLPSHATAGPLAPACPGS